MERRPILFSLGFSKVLLIYFLSLILAVQLAYAEKNEPQLDPLEKARALRQQGRYGESLNILEKEISQKYTADESGQRALYWLDMALDYWNLGEVARAENAFIFVLALLKDGKDEATKEHARTAINVIKLYKEAKGKRQEKKYTEAEQIFLKAIQLAEDAGMKDLELKCLRQLCFVYWDIGNLEKFLKYNESSLELAEELNFKFEAVRSLNNIGVYYFAKKDMSKSYFYFDRALVIAERENLIQKAPECLINLAATAYYLGQYDLSAYYMERALKVYDKEGDLASTISILNSLAVTLYKKQQQNNLTFAERDRVDSLLTTARELSRQAGFSALEARVLNNLGYVSLNDDLAKAEYYSNLAWRKGLEIMDQEVIASALNNLASVQLKRRQIERAKRFYNSALTAALKIDYWAEIWRDYSGLARCYEMAGDYQRALKAYQKALETLNQVRENITFDLYKIGFDREKREVYEGLIRSLFRLRERGFTSQDLDEPLFTYLNRVKARAFMEELSQAGDEKKPAVISEELSSLDRMISDFINQPENLKDENSFSRLLELEYRYLRSLREVNQVDQEAGDIQSGESLSLRSMQNDILGEGQVILNYYLGHEDSYCFIISRHDFQIIKLPAESEIEKSIKLYLKLVAEPAVEREDLMQASFRIAGLLLPPLTTLPKPTRALIIIPDGLLNYLPFETLAVSDPLNPGRKKYLIEEYRVSYSPSMAALRLPEQKANSDHYQKEFLGFGNPYYGSRHKNLLKSRIYYLNGQLAGKNLSLSPLPFSQQELKGIAALFAEQDYDLFLKKKASEENLKNLDLSRYRILHFACHGLVSEQFPQRSSLVLTARSRGKEDGFLTAREIYQLRLKAELVVLSACESSRGTIEKTEGIIGLPRVFLLAGSQAVISSLWSVNDRATQELMREFYQHLLSGEDKDEALRKAKIKMINSSKQHPYYWGAFILIGNSRKIY